MKLQDFVMPEGSEQDCSFFALYAGLRMYKEYKTDQSQALDMFFISAGEAYCMLEKLKEEYPNRYADAELEYESEILTPLK